MLRRPVIHLAMYFTHCKVQVLQRRSMGQPLCTAHEKRTFCRRRALACPSPHPHSIVKRTPRPARFQPIPHIGAAPWPTKNAIPNFASLKNTAPQSSLKRSQRLTNLRDAFAVAPLKAAQLRGKNILLIDDVMTSGATLNFAARVLKQAGASHVGALVLAKTPH